MDLSLTRAVLTITSEILVGFLQGDLLGGRTSPFLCTHHRCLPDLFWQQEGGLSHTGEWDWRDVIGEACLAWRAFKSIIFGPQRKWYEVGRLPGPFHRWKH